MGSPGNSDRGRRMGPATNINENNGVQGPLSVKSTVLPIIKAWCPASDPVAQRAPLRSMSQDTTSI